MNTNLLVNGGSTVAHPSPCSDEDDLRSPTSVVRSALQYLMNNPRNKLPSQIVSIERPGYHSPLGRRRVKFIVTLEDGTAIALQVLNSHRAMQKFRGWVKKCRSLVFAIFVPEIFRKKEDSIHDIVQDVAGKIVEMIRQATSIFRRKVNSIVHHYRIRGNEVNMSQVSEYFCTGRRIKQGYSRFHAPSMCH